MTATIIQFPSRAIVETAWEAYARNLTALASNPSLKADSGFMERLREAEREWNEQYLQWVKAKAS